MATPAVVTFYAAKSLLPTVDENVVKCLYNNKKQHTLGMSLKIRNSAL